LVPGSGSNPNPLSCNASYLVDTINSLTFQGQIVLWESSSVSNGTIVDWFWDFGDGTTINTRYPIHTYAQNSGAFPICLTITAIDSAGTDTCVSTFCDTVGVDSLGNLIFKGQQGLTVNVIDPATVGIDEISAADFRLFPNPARQSATLQWEAATEVNLVEVYSLNGQLQQQIEPEGQELKFSNLASGTYIVRVQTAQTSISLKLQVH
jgi:PKD repeat protein